jgi:epimerase transport system membrane fusion protein
MTNQIIKRGQADYSPAVESGPDVQPETSIEVPRRIGFAMLFAVFGLFGVWAIFAPISGAVLAPGQVTVKSYKKIIQHLEGGIVSGLEVGNGDRVEAGDILLKLDDTQSLALLGVATAQHVNLKAQESRLIAESKELSSIDFPSLWSENLPKYSSEIDSQNAIFRSRRYAREGSIEVLTQRADQLQSQIIGLEALKDSKNTLAASYSNELADVRALLNQGFSDIAILRSVERNLATFEGEAADLTAKIAANRIAISETRLQILQINREFQNEVVNTLADVQARLKDISERMIALQDIVSRTDIKAPAGGIVNGLAVHTAGEVIIAGSPIAEIVPVTEELILEARVPITDIDRVYPSQEARIRFSSFGSSTPNIIGTVLTISADAYLDEANRSSYYLARIEVPPEEIAELGELELLPGMPAEAFITTESRTLVQYLFKPFSNAIARSFIED